MSQYEHAIVGQTARLDNLQAAVLRVQADCLEEWNERRRQVASWYRELLPAGIVCPDDDGSDQSVYHLFVVRVERRDAFRAHLEAHGILSAVHYPVPLHAAAGVPAPGPSVRAIFPSRSVWPAKSCRCPCIPFSSELRFSTSRTSARGSFSPPEPPHRQPSDRTVINIGLIGYGYWGPNLARNLAETDGVHLAAIADTSADRRDAAARRHRGVRRVRRRGEPDCARRSRRRRHRDSARARIIPLAKAAVERGKHVLVEKPLAGSRAHAEALGALAEKHDVRLMVDHTFVYNGAVRRIRALIDSGDLGELLYLDSVRVNLGLFQQDSNVIWDLAAHDLSIMDYLIDARPVAVSADGTAAAGFDHGERRLRHRPLRQRLPRAFSRQLARAGQDSADAARRAASACSSTTTPIPARRSGSTTKASTSTSPTAKTRRQILVSYRTGDMYAPKFDRREALSLVAREFADSIAQHRAPLTDAAAGIRVVALLEAAERSLRAQGKRNTV